jgi:hypothetical protein
MELKIKKETAKEIYKESSNALKKILEETFGKDYFKNKTFDEIKTFEDACEVLDIDPDSVITDQDTTDEAAYKKLKIVAKALTQGWTPDWNNSNQYKWYPYFNLSSGFGFSAAHYDYVDASTTVGSRLCFESEEKAKYAGNQFLQLYKEFLTITN